LFIRLTLLQNTLLTNHLHRIVLFYIYSIVLWLIYFSFTYWCHLFIMLFDV